MVKDIYIYLCNILVILRSSGMMREKLKFLFVTTKLMIKYVFLIKMLKLHIRKERFLGYTVEFVDYRSFFARVPSHIPIVWTFHDMNPFTGGCHYDEGCGRFVECCGGCPQLGSKNLHDLSRQIWRRTGSVTSE